MRLKYNTKQRYKSIQGLRSFKNTLPTKVKRIIDKKGRMSSETLDNWKYIVGDELFKVCYPKSFKSSNKLGGSCLIIMVKRGNEVDLEYSKKKIIDNMNRYFSDTVVEKLKFSSFSDEIKPNFEKDVFKTNVTNNKYKKKVCDVKNEKIKKSLLELTKVFKKK